MKASQGPRAPRGSHGPWEECPAPVRSRLAPALCALVLLLIPLTLPGADTFDLLRLRWREMITLGTNANRSDPLYSGWISAIESTAQNRWSTLLTDPARTRLWEDLPNLGTDSGEISATYDRIRAMALAYSVHGSALEGSAGLQAAILESLEWMDLHIYNQENTSQYGNFFDWQIATPLRLVDITTLMYDDLPAGRRDRYMAAVDHFIPAPVLTAANRTWISSAIALRGILVKDSAKITTGLAGLDGVLSYAPVGDGFHTDGSFLFHDVIPYNGGYGAQLLSILTPVVELFQGSPWDPGPVAIPTLLAWVQNSFEPFLVHGAIMQAVSGRYASRPTDDHESGHFVLSSILRLARLAPAAEGASLNSFVKAQILSDTSLDFVANTSPPYSVWAAAVLADSSVPPAQPPVLHRRFPQMDRVVHRRQGWSMALAMSSARVANYESIRGENLHGWYTGDGMTYLYTPDLRQYSGDFWATIDPYRMPGTTVDSTPRAPGSGEAYLSGEDWVGGADLLDQYGVSGMQLSSWGAGLSARKSWFFFDDEVVCLGSAIHGISGRAVETVVETRRLAAYGDNPLLVNGVAAPASPGLSRTVPSVAWAHLAGNTPGSDLGFFFPHPGDLTLTREMRSGATADLNLPFGNTNQTASPYLSLTLPHGTNPTDGRYAYVLLPATSPADVARYAARPGITVLENSPRAQAVRKDSLGLLAINLWEPGGAAIGGVQVDGPCSVLVRNDGALVDIGLSDPTQGQAAPLTLDLGSPALALLQADAGVTLLRLTPTVRVAFDVAGRQGRTLHARLSLGPSPPLVRLVSSAPSPVVDAPATVTLTAIALDPAGPVARVDVYSHATRIASLSRPPYRITLSNLPPSIQEFTAVAVGATGLSRTSSPPLTLIPSAPALDGSGTGLWGEYHTGPGFTGLALTRVDPTIDFLWGTGSPDPTIGADQFSVRWSGRLQARHAGIHTLHTLSDGGVRLWLGGRLLIDHWESHPGAEDQQSVTLSPGQYYDLMMEYYDDKGAATARLLWTEPGGTREVIPQSQLYPADTGLRGQYFAHPDFTRLAFTRIDGGIDFDWGNGTPHPLLLPGPFSITWKGKLRSLGAGTYQFSVRASGSVKLTLNGQVVVSNPAASPGIAEVGTLRLEAGQLYPLSLDYANSGPAPSLSLAWTPPGGTEQPIPRDRLAPHQNNTPPLLHVPPRIAEAPGHPIAFTATASGEESIPPSLTFSLDGTPPAGASIDPHTGLFTWVPGPEIPAGTYPIAVRVTDDGTPPMTDARQVLITLIPGLTTLPITLVASNATWSYLDGSSPPQADWAGGQGLDSAGWKQGPAPLGYGRGDEATLLNPAAPAGQKPITTWFRKLFFVPDPAQVLGLEARIARASGWVLYLNGTEVARQGLPAGPILPQTTALPNSEGSCGALAMTAQIPGGFLVPGMNMVAVEIHLTSPADRCSGLALELDTLAVVPASAGPLRFQGTGTGMLLSWPSASGLLAPFQTGILGGTGAWSPVAGTPQTEGDSLVLPIGPAPGSTRFFRLQPR